MDSYELLDKLSKIKGFNPKESAIVKQFKNNPTIKAHNFQIEAIVHEYKKMFTDLINKENVFNSLNNFSDSEDAEGFNYQNSIEKFYGAVDSEAEKLILNQEDLDVIGGYSGFKLIDDFYNKCDRLRVVINNLVPSILDYVIFNHDEVTNLKEKAILKEIENKLPAILNCYLKYGGCYVAPRKSSHKHQLLDSKNNTFEKFSKVSTEDGLQAFSNSSLDFLMKDDLSLLSEEDFQLAVLSPLEVFPVIRLLPEFNTTLYREYYLRAYSLGYIEGDPMVMIYNRINTNTIYNSMLIPINSKTEGYDKNQKSRYNGLDVPLFTAHQNIFESLETAINVNQTIMPFLNMINQKTGNLSYAEIGTALSNEPTIRNLVETLQNVDTSGKSLIISNSSPLDEFRVENANSEHGRQLFHAFEDTLMKTVGLIPSSPLQANCESYTLNIPIMQMYCENVVIHNLNKIFKMLELTYGISDLSNKVTLDQVQFCFKSPKSIRAFTSAGANFLTPIYAKGEISNSDFFKKTMQLVYGAKANFDIPYKTPNVADATIKKVDTATHGLRDKNNSNDTNTNDDKDLI